MKLLSSGKGYVSVLLIVAFWYVPFGCAEEVKSGDTSQKQRPAAFKEEADWSEDISGKIEKTIQVLDVVKGELQDLREKDELKEEQARHGIAEEGDLAEKIRGKPAAAVRVWKKVKKIVGTEPDSAVQKAGTVEESEWAVDMNNRLDKAIRAIMVIKEELKEIEDAGEPKGEEARENKSITK